MQRLREEREQYLARRFARLVEAKQVYDATEKRTDCHMPHIAKSRRNAQHKTRSNPRSKDGRILPS